MMHEVYTQSSWIACLGSSQIYRIFSILQHYLVLALLANSKQSPTVCKGNTQLCCWYQFQLVESGVTTWQPFDLAVQQLPREDHAHSFHSRVDSKMLENPGPCYQVQDPVILLGCC